MEKFSHINEEGKATMVDVGWKENQKRTAKAEGSIILNESTIDRIRANQIKKGDVLTVAEIAGIQAAKNTSNLIPLCHTLMITKVEIKCVIEANYVKVNSLVKCEGKTGVEMEALTAVSVALLTIYDMCKAVDKSMSIGGITLLDKIKEDI